MEENPEKKRRSSTLLQMKGKQCSSSYKFFVDVENAFKKYEQFTSESILKGDVKQVLKQIIPEYSLEDNDGELNQILVKYIKTSKYTIVNKETKKLETKYLENTVDFPSVLAVIVHFLKKFTLKDGEVLSEEGDIEKRKSIPDKEDKSNNPQSTHQNDVK